MSWIINLDGVSNERSWTMTVPAVRVRRLPDEGMFRRRVFEVELSPATGSEPANRFVTRRPYGLLKSVLGWDEIALVESRASKAWQGGIGPWCSAFTGELSTD